MAVISTLSIGGVSHSVYALTGDPVGDADDYHGATFGSSWADLSTLEKQQALVSAARLLDRAILWSGAVTVVGQARAWPRDGATNGCTGKAVTDGTTPDDLAYGEFELAALIAEDADLLSSTGTGSNAKRVKAGSAEVEFFQPTLGTNDETRLPTAVHDLVACYQEGSGGILPSSGSLSSGTGDSSSFDDCDQYNRTEGYP